MSTLGGATRRDKTKLFSLILLWAVLFSPIFPQMFREWLEHSDNSHGIIVPFVAGYFAWQRKDRLRSACIGSAWYGGVVLLTALVVYVVCYAGGSVFPTRLAFVFSLVGLLWFCLGSEITGILAFPVLFLLFMIPVPYSILSLVSAPLQLLATKISANLISFCSIPVLREGNMLYFVDTQLEVAEACSGIRSIMSLSMLAVAFASMSNGGWKAKTGLVISAVPIAMIANILRITGTGILANFFGDKVARGFLHEFSGIVLFIFGFFVLLGLFTLINRKKGVDAN